jgi:hypothetical protein
MCVFYTREILSAYLDTYTPYGYIDIENAHAGQS